MGREPQAVDSETSSDPRERWTRRQALKTGVGLGVGAIAWTGPTITSVGATPGYAAGCTFAVERVLADDRNTDQGASCVKLGGFGYHDTDLVNFPTGYYMVNPNDPVGDTNPGWNSKVCSTNTDPYELFLYWPKAGNLNCAVVVEFFLPNTPEITLYSFEYYNPVPLSANDNEYWLKWHLPTGEEVQEALTELSLPEFDPQTRYRVVLRCVTQGLEWCFDT